MKALVTYLALIQFSLISLKVKTFEKKFLVTSIFKKKHKEISLISVLASKSGQIKKIRQLYYVQGQTISKANYAFLNSPKKRTKLTILSKEHRIVSFFRFWEN